MSAAKRKAAASPPPLPPGEALAEVVPLGAGQEVGRSCVVLKYQ